MVTYIVNVNNSINMAYYDFFFYEAEAEGKIMILNVDSLKKAEKQIDDMLIELEERYFEDGDQYRIVFCIPRYISGIESFAENSDLVLSYQIKNCLGDRFTEYDKVFVFSFVYCQLDNISEFENENRSITNNFHSTVDTHSFPDFSSQEVVVNSSNVSAFFEEIESKIQSADCDEIREIFGEAWNQFGIKTADKEILTSEQNAFGAVFHEISKQNLPADHFIMTAIDNNGTAGSKNTEIAETLKIINFFLNEHPMLQSEYDEASIDLEKYAEILSEYRGRLKAFSKVNPPQKEFEFEYRTPESAIDECREQYKAYNEKVYNAINDKQTSVFSDTVKTLIKNCKKNGSEKQWDETYGKILQHIEYADGSLDEYMKRMSEAFAKSEIQSERIIVSADDIGLMLSELEVEYKNTNKEFFELCELSEVGYKTMLDTKNMLAKLNRSLKGVIRAEKYQKLGAFLLTLMVAFLTVMIPYSIGETHVFANFSSLIVWLLCNAAFAAVMLPAAIAVHLYFSEKRRKLMALISKTCDEYFSAYLENASMFSDKLKLIAKIERIGSKMDFLTEADRNFKEYEKKLSYHKQCMRRLRNGLQYFSGLMRSAKAEIKSESYDVPLINLDKDEKRNPFYYPKSVEND